MTEQATKRDERGITIDTIAVAIEIIAANGRPHAKAALGISNQDYPRYLREAVSMILYDRLRHEAAISIITDSRLYHRGSAEDYDELAAGAERAARSITEMVLSRLDRRGSGRKITDVSTRDYYRDEHGALRRKGA